MIADAFVCYRTYVVWGKRRWALIGPAILCLGTCGEQRASCLQLLSIWPRGPFINNQNTSFLLSRRQLPLMLIYFYVAAGIGFLSSYSRNDLSPLNKSLLQKWTIAWFALTMSTNILCTCAMAYRIIRAQRGSVSIGGPTGDGKRYAFNLGGIVVVLIESAALYTMATMAAMICLTLNQTGTFTISSMV